MRACVCARARVCVRVCMCMHSASVRDGQTATHGYAGAYGMLRGASLACYPQYRAAHWRARRKDIQPRTAKNAAACSLGRSCRMCTHTRRRARVCSMRLSLSLCALLAYAHHVRRDVCSIEPRELKLIALLPLRRVHDVEVVAGRGRAAVLEAPVGQHAHAQGHCAAY